MNTTAIPTGFDFANQKQRQEIQYINLQLTEVCWL
jgi:hypothetical protein